MNFKVFIWEKEKKTVFILDDLFYEPNVYGFEKVTNLLFLELE